MRRALRICVIAAAAVVATTAVAASAIEPSRASLKDPVCRQAANALDRAVAITAVMRPVTGTERMQLEFNLLEKPRGQPSYSPVTGGDLGKWISPSNPTLGQRPADQWNLRKEVVNLPGPVVYRFRVAFRWIGAHGRSLGRRYRWSPPCDQP
jgi:hypothetical protein